jgi:hypothetical protein
MRTGKKPDLTSAEQSLLDGVTVRPIINSERKRFDELIISQHYLHTAELVGEQLRYVAEYQGEWVALLAWCAGSFNLKDREKWIDWDAKQKARRLRLVVNNSRFLILETGRSPNLASRVMKLCLNRLSADWKSVYEHEVLVAESFVDSQLFRGTCYKASGWTLLGQTKGYGRSREDYYVEHERPKQLWVKELRAGARTILRGRNLPDSLKALDEGRITECPFLPDDMSGMLLFFNDLPEWRSRKNRYRLSSLVTIAVCASLCGVHQGQRDLAAFAANMTRAQWAALRLPRRGNPRQYQVPSEATFFRMLSGLDNRALENALLAWQDHVLGPQSPDDDHVAVDGKELLSSQGINVVSAYAVKSGRWLGSERVAGKSNEIPAAQTLLQRAPIEGRLVSLDALHTQTETARIIVEERGGDYLMTAKGNQKTVKESVQQLHDGLQHAFSP